MSTNLLRSLGIPSVAFYLTISLIIAAPLIRSGKTADSLLLIEIIGCLTLLSHFWSIRRINCDKSIIYIILATFAVLAIYLLPLPDALWSKLPGRTLQVEIIHWIETNSDITPYKALSLYPLHSLSALLVTLPMLAIFLSACNSSEQQVFWLSITILLSASLQGTIALLQYLTDIPLFYFGFMGHGNAVLGTYINTNHLTAFMEMAEPLALVLMIQAIVDTRHTPVKKSLIILTHATISLLLTFIAFTTTSRMGTILLILSIVVSFWAVTTPEIRKRVALPILLLRIVLLAVIVWAQYSVVQTVASTAAELQPEQVLGDLRWSLFQSSWQGIQAFFPFGSGLGTFPQTIQPLLDPNTPAYQTHFVNHVHNDYLEFIYETGLLGIALLTSFFYLYIKQWKNLYRLPHGQIKSLQSAAGFGALILLIFSLTDFNLHTPANLLIFCFMCGLFFRKITPQEINTKAEMVHTKSPQTATNGHPEL